MIYVEQVLLVIHGMTRTMTDRNNGYYEDLIVGLAITVLCMSDTDQLLILISQLRRTCISTYALVIIRSMSDSMIVDGSATWRCHIISRIIGQLVHAI
jgi:hypothetical protein